MPDAQRRAIFKEDFARAAVPTSERHGALDLSLTRMTLTVTASDLIFGYTIGIYFDFTTAIIVAACSCAIITVFSTLTGLVGYRERTTFAVVSRHAFGRVGSRLPSAVSALISTGFCGVILATTIDVFPARSVVTDLIYTLVLGVVVCFACNLGFANSLRWLGRIGIPITLALVIFADVVVVMHSGGWSAIMHTKPAHAGEMTFAAMLALGVTKYMNGVTTTPDLMRFGRNLRSVPISTIAQFMVGNLGMNVLGLILGVGLGAADLGKAFSLIGLSILATILFAVQGIASNTNQLYSAGLAVSNLINARRWVINIVIGVVGAALCFTMLRLGVISTLLSYLSYIAYAIPGIPGVILADYLLFRRWRHGSDRPSQPAVRWEGLTAYGVTVVISIYLGVAFHDVMWRSLPLLGSAVYVLVVLVAHVVVRRGRQPATAQLETTPAGVVPGAGAAGAETSGE